MDTKQLQNILNSLKLIERPLVADGIVGKQTMSAVDKLLENSQAPEWLDWSDSRRLVAAEQMIYEANNIEIGDVDGIVGEQTRHARRVWEARQKNEGKPDAKVENWRDKDSGPTPIETPKRKVWPRQDQVESFYGRPGTGFVSMQLPFPMRIAYDPKTTVTRASVHGKCKEAFETIWRNVLLEYGYEEIRRLRLDLFGGCANVRKMRGGSRWSMHAFACAWDVDPDRNQLNFKREQASLDDAPYARFWKIVEDEGAISLGRLRNYDWMHFQFTRDLS